MHYSRAISLKYTEEVLLERMLDLGQFDLGQSRLFRVRPMTDLGQFELGQFDLGQFDWQTSKPKTLKNPKP